VSAGSRARSESRANARHAHAATDLHQTEQDDAGFEVLPDSEPAAPASWSDRPNEPAASWMVSSAPDPATSVPTRCAWTNSFVSAGLRVQGEDAELEMPGPFFDKSTWLYPWLHPNWIHWLGLSFMTELASCMIAGAGFIFAIVVYFGLFGSIFTVASMVMGCLALSAFIATTFVRVIEQTANGVNRLERLPGLAWWETLPPFFRTVGAAGLTLLIVWAICYSVRGFVPWYDPRLLLLNAAIGYVLFPVLLLANLVEQSWLPLFSLWPTVSRVFRCGGHFVLFLMLSGMATAILVIVLVLLVLVHFALGLIAAGPLIAAWLLYYAHWLGRLARQLMALD
jgi:hypothetical protein